MRGVTSHIDNKYIYEKSIPYIFLNVNRPESKLLGSGVFAPAKTNSCDCGVAGVFILPKVTRTVRGVRPTEYKLQRLRRFGGVFALLKANRNVTAVTERKTPTIVHGKPRQRNRKRKQTVRTVCRILKIVCFRAYKRKAACFAVRY